MSLRARASERGAWPPRARALRRGGRGTGSRVWEALTDGARIDDPSRVKGEERSIDVASASMVVSDDCDPCWPMMTVNISIADEDGTPLARIGDAKALIKY